MGVQKVVQAVVVQVVQVAVGQVAVVQVVQVAAVQVVQAAVVQVVQVAAVQVESPVAAVQVESPVAGAEVETTAHLGAEEVEVAVAVDYQCSNFCKQVSVRTDIQRRHAPNNLRPGKMDHNCPRAGVRTSCCCWSTNSESILLAFHMVRQ